MSAMNKTQVLALLKENRNERGIANWKTLTRYDATQTQALDTALSHVCSAGGASAIG